MRQPIWQLGTMNCVIAAMLGYFAVFLEVKMKTMLFTSRVMLVLALATVPAGIDLDAWFVIGVDPLALVVDYPIAHDIARSN